MEIIGMQQLNNMIADELHRLTTPKEKFSIGEGTCFEFCSPRNEK